MISIRYYLHNKANKKGLHPLYMSVQLDGSVRLQQAVGESLNPKQWHQENQKVTHKHVYFKEMNTRLDSLKTKVKLKFQEMMDEGELPPAPTCT
jgi:hypothetical protein